MSRLLSALIFSLLITALTVPNVNAANNNNSARKMYDLGRKYKDGINHSNRDDFVQDLTSKSRKTLSRKARRDAQNLGNDMGVEVSETDRTKGQYTVKKKRKKNQTTRHYTGKNGKRTLQRGGRGRTLGGSASSGVNN